MLGVTLSSSRLRISGGNNDVVVKSARAKGRGGSKLRKMGSHAKIGPGLPSTRPISAYLRWMSNQAHAWCSEILEDRALGEIGEQPPTDCITHVDADA